MSFFFHSDDYINEAYQAEYASLQLMAIDDQIAELLDTEEAIPESLKAERKHALTMTRICEPEGGSYDNAEDEFDDIPY